MRDVINHGTTYHTSEIPDVDCQKDLEYMINRSNHKSAKKVETLEISHKLQKRGQIWMNVTCNN